MVAKAQRRQSCDRSGLPSHYGDSNVGMLSRTIKLDSVVLAMMRDPVILWLSVAAGATAVVMMVALVF